MREKYKKKIQKNFNIQKIFSRLKKKLQFFELKKSFEKKKRLEVIICSSINYGKETHVAEGLYEEKNVNRFKYLQK